MKKKKEVKLDLFVNGEKVDCSSYLKLIENQHRMLCSWRDDGRIPSRHLLEDIAVYEFILKHDNPDRAADVYMSLMSELREKKGDLVVTKMEVAKRLGWEVKI